MKNEKLLTITISFGTFKVDKELFEILYNLFDGQVVMG